MCVCVCVECVCVWSVGVCVWSVCGVCVCGVCVGVECVGGIILLQGTIIVASFAASPFSVLCHRRENWRNKERKKEATKKKESLPC